MLAYNFLNLLYFYNIKGVDLIYNLTLYNDYFLSFFLGEFILFYNKYKFIDFYYYVYVHFYLVYKFFKKILILIYFNILKLYIIFLNDTMFFSFNNNLFILLFKLKKQIIYTVKISNKVYFKFRRKYKYYYRFGQIGYLRVFFFLIVFWLLILM